MKLWHSVIIAIGLVIGLVLHSAINNLPELARENRAREMQIRMLEVSPKEVSIGDAKVLYLPAIRYKNQAIEVVYEFYTFSDGELKRVNVTQN